MLKRVLAFLFSIVFAVSLVACNKDPQNPSTENTGTDSSPSTSSQSSETDTASVTDSVSDTVTNTDTNAATDSASTGSSSNTDSSATTDTNSSTNTDTSTDKQPDTEVVVTPDQYNDSLSHLFFATDTTNFAITLFDLNRCNGDWSKLKDDSCIVWKWNSEEDPNCKYTSIIGNGITAAKLRTSPKYGEVVISCSAGGWVGIIDYKTRTVVYEARTAEKATSPHDIEMLPNGDLAVIGSEGKLYYFALSAGDITEPTATKRTDGGHGVCWDPKQECLWVLSNTNVNCVEIEGYGTSQVNLVFNSDKGVEFRSDDKEGHALSPMFGSPGKYWFTAINSVWIFDSTTNTYEKAPDYCQNKNVKGIAYFADGTMIQTPAEMGPDSADWYSDGFNVIVYDESKTEPTVTEIYSDSRTFYKVFPVTKNYQ